MNIKYFRTTLYLNKDHVELIQKELALEDNSLSRFIRQVIADELKKRKVI